MVVKVCGLSLTACTPTLGVEVNWEISGGTGNLFAFYIVSAKTVKYNVFCVELVASVLKARNTGSAYLLYESCDDGIMWVFSLLVSVKGHG